MGSCEVPQKNCARSVLSLLRLLDTDKHQDKQTPGQANTRTSKHLDKQTPGQANTRTSKHQDKQTPRQANTRTSKHQDKLSNI